MKIKQKFKKSAIIIPATALLIAVGASGTALAQGFDDNENMREHQEKHIQIKSAIASADYDTFLELVADAPFDVDINEETFAKMVEAHALMEAGDRQGAHEIMEELDFPMRRQRMEKAERDGSERGEADGSAKPAERHRGQK